MKLSHNQSHILYTLLVIFLLSNTSLVSAQEFKVLVFSKTEGFRHGSIPDGINAIRRLGTDNNFEVEATEDASAFTLTNLENFKAVVFLSTTGNVLNASQQTAFEQYIGNGGGFVGIHAASDTEYSWPWYGGLVGAYFDGHPDPQEATIEVADKVHPSTEFLPDYWVRTDEWYDFDTNPRGDVHVLATIDEKTYSGGKMGFDHPIAWCHEYEGGRAWYTGGGHTSASFSEPDFLNHILGGIRYAAGAIVDNYDATINDKYVVEVVDNNPNNAIELAVLPDLSVLYIERAGAIKLKNSETGLINTLATLDVDAGREDGLIGLALDPDFESNNWIYLFYSPQSANEQRVSRFDLVNKSFNAASEKILLSIPTQRSQCCHSGGDLEFDKNGNLFITTGDNVNPFESDGYAPIDERSGRSAWDAQGTSANTMDLRGKILRIHPEDNGTYTIPAGNLFSNPSDGKPEIYVMGCRNPYRLAVNQKNDEIVWGEVGPDARDNSSSRGPRGYDEFNKTRTSGNFGWPYIIADNQAYKDYNFSNGASGDFFDPGNLTNNSPNNTGPQNIPPAIGAWIHYPYTVSTEFPELENGGRTAIAGGYYHFDPTNTNPSRFPEYFDNSLFIMEWARNWIKEVRFDKNGNLLQINSFLDNLPLRRPIDMQFGPDGALYVIEWGTGFGGNNADARIIKIGYQGVIGNQPPLAIASASTLSGQAPLTIDFAGDQSSDPNIGDKLSYSWDFNEDGIEDAATPNASFTYTTNGQYQAVLRVTDEEGESSASQLNIVVGNTAPNVVIDFPVNGGFYFDNEVVQYKISSLDEEDGSDTDCLQVVVEPSIGHDDHSHGIGDGPRLGCAGDFVAQSHGDGPDNVFHVINATYTDKGGAVNVPLASSLLHILQPKVKQAEHYQEAFNLRSEGASDFLGGGSNLGFIKNGSYIMFSPMNFQDIDFVTYRWASLQNDCWIEIRVDSPDGELIAKNKLSPTGGWQSYDFYTTEINDIGGTHDVYFVFTNPATSGFLGNINWIEFHGKGISLEDYQKFNGLTAEYFPSDDFSGEPIIRNDPMIAWNWESVDGGTSTDEFSVRWEGQIDFPAFKEYELIVEKGDGEVTVWINDQKIIDGDQLTAKYNNNKSAPTDVKVEYKYTTGSPSIALKWDAGEEINVIHTNYLLAKEVDGEEITGLEDLTDLTSSIHPNPVENILHLSNNLQFSRYRILNTIGKEVQHGRTSETLPVDKLPAGYYLLQVGERTLRFVVKR